MKIAFLGNFNVDYTSESHYLKTFERLGHEVIQLQEGQRSSQQILKYAQDCDLFFWVHTHGWHTQGIEKVIAILKEKGIPTVGYHLDLWLGIERQKDLKTDPYWNIDYFFSVDMLMVEYLNQNKSLPKAFFLPAGVLEDESYRSTTEVPQFQHDVAFTGSKNYHKEWPYRSELITWLEDTYGDRFKLYEHSHVPKMRGEMLNHLYANTKVMVGDTLCKGFDYPWYLSDRIFETIGRGGFIIHPYIEGLETMFNLPIKKDGILDTSKAELITYEYGDFETLEYLIDYFIDNEEEREVIRKRGQKRVLKEHTYTQRLSQLLNIVEDERK